ncbi:hypothetical protein Taro_054983, partial [Colocasia esculenta]|nr:hypothetical protein [Colocasia esculenta]
MKKWSTSVDTSPSQVDTRDSSQRNMSTGFYIRCNWITSRKQIKWKQSIEKTSRKIPKIRVQSIGQGLQEFKPLRNSIFYKGV